MNNDISLIIPIKGREEFTFRILSYLYLSQFPYKIFISDGSINKSENKKIISLFKSKLNIEYLNFPYDTLHNNHVQIHKILTQLLMNKQS